MGSTAIDRPNTKGPLMEPSVNDDLHAARVLLSEQNIVDGRRFGLAKRFVMRGSRMFTHRLVAAGGHLADAVQRVDDRRRADTDGLRGDLALIGDRATLARQHADAVGRDVESRAEQRHEQALAELALANQRLQAVTATVATLESVVQSLQTRLTATEKAALYQRSELLRAALRRPAAPAPRSCRRRRRRCSSPPSPWPPWRCSEPRRGRIPGPAGHS